MYINVCNVGFISTFSENVFSMFHASDKGDRRDDQCCKGGGGGHGLR